MKPLMNFSDGTSIQWIDRETFRFTKGDFVVDVWIDFAPGFFFKKRVVYSAMIDKWTRIPAGASEIIAASDLDLIIDRIRDYVGSNNLIVR